MFHQEVHRIRRLLRWPATYEEKPAYRTYLTSCGPILARRLHVKHQIAGFLRLPNSMAQSSSTAQERAASHYPPPPTYPAEASADVDTHSVNDTVNPNSRPARLIPHELMLESVYRGFQPSFLCKWFTGGTTAICLHPVRQDFCASTYLQIPRRYLFWSLGICMLWYTSKRRFLGLWAQMFRYCFFGSTLRSTAGLHRAFV